MNIKKFFVLQLVAAEKNEKNPEAGQDATSRIEKGKVVAGGVRIENGKVVAPRNHYYLFTRWGRQGELGRCVTYGPFNRHSGESEFKKIFKDKPATNGSNARRHLSRTSIFAAQHLQHLSLEWNSASNGARRRTQRQKGRLQKSFTGLTTDGSGRLNDTNT